MSRLPTLPLAAKVRTVVLALAFALAFAGCRRSLAPGEFEEAYREENGSEFLSEDYKVTVLPLTDEYLASRLAAIDSGRTASMPASGMHGKGLRISVQIEPRKVSGDMEDQRKDLLNGALLQGPEAYRKRLQFLENGVSIFASLECGEERFPPVAYRFNRGTGFPAVHAFIFLFNPETGAGKIPASDCEFALKDFGIGTGTVKASLRNLGRLTLKTRDKV